MTQQTVQCTTVRKTLRTSPRAWAYRRTWDAAVGQRWGRVLCDRRFTDNEFAKLCVARMSRARETEHLSFRPVPVWPFFSHTPSPPLLLSFPGLPPSPYSSLSSDDTYRIAPSPPALDTEPGMRTALAEERWLCTNSPTWETHISKLSRHRPF